MRVGVQSVILQLVFTKYFFWISTTKSISQQFLEIQLVSFVSFEKEKKFSTVNEIKSLRFLNNKEFVVNQRNTAYSSI